MYAIAVTYAGWCEVRLATNPDPTDEPRGASGYSFAVVGEPDFDRVIRFHDPVCARPGVPLHVGVHVVFVSLLGMAEGGEPQSTVLPAHPFVGGRVELLNADGEPPGKPDPLGPKFEARGDIIGRPAEEPIYPYHLRLTSKDGRSSVDRKVDFKKAVHLLSLKELAPYGAPDMPVRVAGVAAATGICDPVGFRQQRRMKLEQLREREVDPVQRCALEQRIAELRQSPTADEVASGIWDRRTLALTGYQGRTFSLDGIPRILGDSDQLCPQDLGSRFVLDDERPWPTQFWFGAWDCDALYAYTQGVVVLPLKAEGQKA